MDNHPQTMDDQLLYIVSIIGGATMLGVFIRMRGGFGPMNLRAVGIILIGTFAAILAVSKEQSLNASLGILGAIAGYLFGYRDSKEKEEGASSNTISDTHFGENATIVGRDLNQSIANMQTELAKIGQVINNVSNEVIRNEDGEMILKMVRRFRWESEDAEFLGDLSAIDRNDKNWFSQYVELTLNNKFFREKLDYELYTIRAEGWTPAAISMNDNVRGGILCDIEVHRKLSR